MSAPSVEILCPACDEAICVPIDAAIVNGDEAHEGRAGLVCTPDMADLWAHMWTHDDERTQ